MIERHGAFGELNIIENYTDFGGLEMEREAYFGGLHILKKNNNLGGLLCGDKAWRCYWGTGDYMEIDSDFGD